MQWAERMQTLLLRSVFVILALFAHAVAAPNGSAHASETTAAFAVVDTVGDPRELTCAASSAGALWLGTLGAGMVRVTDRGPVRLGAGAGLPGERVRDCGFDGPTLWAATEAGLARWDAHSERFVVVARGRMLRLGFGARSKLAADGLGRVLSLEPDGVREIARLDFAPSAFAVSADGAHWAAGSTLGQLFVRGERVPALDPREPIEALVWNGPVLRVRTTDHELEYSGGMLRMLGRRQPPRLRAAGVRIAAETDWRGAKVLATDGGAFIEEPAGKTYRPLDLGATLPCGDRISALAVHRGTLYAGSFDRGVCRRDAQGWTRLEAALPSNMINDLVSDGTRLFVATARGLAVLEPDGQLRRFDHRACIGKLKNDCPWSPSVNGVAFDAQRSEAWISDLRAVHRFAPRGWKHVGGEAVGSLALTRIAARGGEVAVGSGDQGVLIGRGGRFERIDDQAGLADNWVMDLTYDPAGRLWVATCTRGVSVREPDGTLRTLTRADGLVDDYTLSVTALGDAVWVGTLSGVSIFRAGRVQSLTTADGLSGNEVHDAVLFEGRVWLATDAGLSVVARTP